jgi:Uma2 family endonuclease
MHISAVRDAPTDPLLQPTHHRWSVADYYRMAESGVLTERDRVELIEGELIDMAPIGSRHAYAVTHIAALFRAPAGQFLVSVQNPVRLSGWSEPQPDIALLRPGNYADAHPGPDDVLLIVEVAESSLQYDRDVKLALYARYGIPEAWLVDVVRNTITLYRDPAPHGYRSMAEPRRDETIAPQQLPELVLEVARLLPDAR